MSNRDRRYNQGSTHRTDSRSNKQSNNSRDFSRRRSRYRSPRPFIQKGSDLYLLDILQHGGVDQAHHAWDPIAQILVLPDFDLYEVTLNKNKIVDLTLEEKYNFDIGKDALFIKVNKKLEHDQLTPASENSLPQVILKYVENHEERFINFLNKVGPITIKRHYLEVLPGVGKKLMNEILTQRNLKPFESYTGVMERVPNFKVIEVIAKRIVEEIQDDEVKHRLFVRKKRPENQGPPHTRPHPRTASRTSHRNYR